MNKLSVVIITFNEEKNIERCLNSVVGVADEIIVVDSYSTDKTKFICEKFTLKFIENPFEGHIQQKNWAKDQASFDFVLSLDADEALDDELIEEIKHLKNENQLKNAKMNRLTNYCGKWIFHCGWYPDTKLRMWNRKEGVWKGDNPHDKFELFEESLSIHHLNGNILHYSYYTIEDHYKQVNYFTSVLAKAQFKRGKRVNLLILIGSPVVKFIKDYVIKLGFLDGKMGFRISRISAYATFLKYKKLNQLYKTKK